MEICLDDESTQSLRGEMPKSRLVNFPNEAPRDRGQEVDGEPRPGRSRYLVRPLYVLVLVLTPCLIIWVRPDQYLILKGRNYSPKYRQLPENFNPKDTSLSMGNHVPGTCDGSYRCPVNVI